MTWSLKKRFAYRIRALVGISLFLLLIGSSTGVAVGQNGVMPGVKHLAIIIANEDYDGDGVLRTLPKDIPPPGMFKDLANPCRDATMFRDRLIAAKWQPSEIMFFGCNVKTSTMREQLTKFRKALAITTNTVAIFYYSGHAAQFSDSETAHSFLFGVQAKVDFKEAADSLKATPQNTSFIADQAIDLEELLGSVGLLQENALLIILDACRDNPLYGQIRDMDQAPKVSPIVTNADFDGVVIAYATSPAATASDGPGDHSAYSYAWASLLKDSKSFDSIMNNLKPAMFKYAHTVRPSWRPNQRPVRTGNFAGDWCVWACPPDAVPTAVTQRTSSLIVPNRRPVRPLQALSMTDSPGLKSVSWYVGGGQVAPATSTSLPTFPAVATTFDIQERSGNPNLRPSSSMRFDIFWCDGGDGAVDRLHTAKDISDSLGRIADGQLKTLLRPEGAKTLTGQVITSVRIRRLSQNANVAAGYRYRDNLVVFDNEDKRERKWAFDLSAMTNGDVSPEGNSSRTPGYISVFICRAPVSSTQIVSEMYLQTPSNVSKEAGQAIIDAINNKVAGVKAIGFVEKRDDGPALTEIRYFDFADRDNAFKTAKEIERLLHRDVRIQFMPILLTPDSKNHVELWIGLTDPPPKR